jgi:ABC-type uncharacterized transport system permease subunit
MANTFLYYGPLIWLAYVALAARLVIARGNDQRAPSARELRFEHALLGLLLLAHAPLVFHPLAGSPPHFGAREALVLLTWLATLIYWTAAFLMRLEGLQVILMPVAALCQAVAQLLPAGHATPWLHSPLMQAHLTIAMLAYGFFAVAAGLAVLMRVADRQLHHPTRNLLSQLPPLLALERLLFMAMGLGFALLTATLATGAVFSEELFGKPVEFTHKVVFSVAAWLLFGWLLWARRSRGLRGRIAVNWTLAGFALLVLAYIGSRFVLDALLHRAG